MRRVVIESPWATRDAEQQAAHRAYLHRALSDALSRGEAPIASHGLLTDVLDDHKPAHRDQGMAAGHAWIPLADAVIAYADLGITDGMDKAFTRAEEHGTPVEIRWMDMGATAKCG